MAMTFTCDKCGCVLADRVRPLTLSGWKDGYQARTDKLHLCSPCYDAVKAFVGAASEEPHPEPEERP